MLVIGGRAGIEIQSGCIASSGDSYIMLPVSVLCT